MGVENLLILKSNISLLKSNMKEIDDLLVLKSNISFLKSQSDVCNKKRRKKRVG
ncbi:MAG: hypothetical protein JWN56_1829 [Sphingobacteriales bacterium]|nr:hypothetical protein [Sphingobacteriales bacterium]